MAAWCFSHLYTQNPYICSPAFHGASLGALQVPLPKSNEDLGQKWPRELILSNSPAEEGPPTTACLGLCLVRFSGFEYLWRWDFTTPLVNLCKFLVTVENYVMFRSNFRDFNFFLLPLILSLGTTEKSPGSLLCFLFSGICTHWCDLLDSSPSWTVPSLSVSPQTKDASVP